LARVHVDPTPEQAQAFSAQAERTEPVFMLNLLRFKERADGIDAGDSVSGLEAYQRYAATAASHLERVGGEVLWAGICDPALIGPSVVQWDIAAVVRYPSRAAFLQMVADPDYLATTAHRSAGLADSRLIPCSAAPLVR
jgi:uncharacterized protein (DUF1330 family)